jgi:hypothetical protein
MVENKNRSISLVALIALVLIAWIALVFLLPIFVSFESKDSHAFDAISSLVSGLAFAAIIYTINLQKEELALQRKELADTRREFETQNQTLKKQRFENTFFSLITIQHGITEKISAVSQGEVVTGRESVSIFYNEFKGSYLNRFREMGEPPLTKVTVDLHKRITIEVFSEFYQDLSSISAIILKTS